MTSDAVQLQIHDQVATLTLNRPECHNAFDDAMVRELHTALLQVSSDANVRVLVLTALGKSFSAGADAAWMQRMSQYTYSQNAADATALADLMDTLAHLPQPTLALVQGSAFGGGVGLIACCDIAIATPQSQFCLTEVKLGLIPAVISPYVLRCLGVKMTQYYALTAEQFDAHRAQQLGLITAVVAPEQLAARGANVIDTLLRNAPIALTECKRFLNQAAEPTPFAHRKALSIETIARLRVSPEGQTGLQAFLNKRTPQW